MNKTLKKIKIYCRWCLEVDFFFSKQVEVFVDTFEGMDRNNESIKILYLCEPDEILGIYKEAIKKSQSFNYILTHDEVVLRKCKNAIFFPFGTCWIRNYKFSFKKFGVSTVVGAKNITKGHRLRHRLWKNQNKIKIPKRFFLSMHAVDQIKNLNNNPILGEKKDQLFNYQLHIAIENVRKNNWFTEKIIDCFRTKVIPIYWGCPNIANFFDANGILHVKNLRQLLKVVNSVNSNTYSNLKGSIEKNYKLAETYVNLRRRFKAKLEEILLNTGFNKNE